MSSLLARRPGVICSLTSGKYANYYFPYRSSASQLWYVDVQWHALVEFMDMPIDRRLILNVLVLPILQFGGTSV